MNNHKYLLIVLLAEMVSFLTFSQANLVPNPSFEEKDWNIFPNKPDGPAQLEKCNDWKNFETSDWYSSAPGFYNGKFISESTSNTGDPMSAHSGTHYIGFGPCEGAQVKLNSKIGKYQFVQVAFWFSPFKRMDTKINIYLLPDKAGNNALNDCYNPNITFEFHDVIDINSSGPDSIHHPGQWYQYISKPFLITEGDYEWIAIKGDNHEGALNNVEYMYVDDVQVVSTELCDHICLPDLPDITYGSLQNTMIGNTLFRFNLLIKDAMGVEFIVFSTEGQEMYNYDCFDPNGLKNDGYDDFLLEWNGNDNWGDNMPEDAYTYYIRMWNCHDEVIFDQKSITVSPPEEAAFVVPEFHNNELENCCEENKYFQNIQIAGIERTDVNDFITAGENVTSGTPGPVIIKNGANVIWRAGNEINVEPGFEVEPGAYFDGGIASCGATIALRKAEPVSRLTAENQSNSIAHEAKDNSIGNEENIEKTEERDFLPDQRYLSTDITINPNPSISGVFIVSGLKVFPESFEAKYRSWITVYNVLGEVVYKSSNLTSPYSIDISLKPKGIYFVKIQNDEEITVQKIIYQ